MVTWLDQLKTEVEDGLSVEWKAFSLEQQNSTQGKDFMMWEHPEYPCKGVPALVAGKAAKNQGEESFLRFHLAAYRARHDYGEDIADRQVLKKIAKKADLDLGRFEKDMDGDKIWRQVGEDHMESKKKKPDAPSFRRIRPPIAVRYHTLSFCPFCGSPSTSMPCFCIR